MKKYIETEQPLSYSPRMKQYTNTAAFETFILEGIEKQLAITAIFKWAQLQGFTGSCSSVRNKVKQLKTAPHTIEMYNRRHIVSLFWRYSSQLTENERQLINHTLTAYPATQTVYAFTQLFREAYQALDYPYFLRLLTTFQASDCKKIKRYIFALREDLEAIKASFFYTYNTSIVEGQINCLKMIKRLMYGRASLELLEKRVIMSQ